jgi:hypothetical protein
MIRHNGLVDVVREFSRQPIGLTAETIGRPTASVAVTFAGGQRAAVDMSERRGQVLAEVLHSLHESGQPAYVEIDPQSGLITELLLAITYRVGRLLPADPGVEVELVVSHAMHFLRPTNPRFAELRATLEAARKSGSYVVVSETHDEHEIVDVRPAPGQGGRTG